MEQVLRTGIRGKKGITTDMKFTRLEKMRGTRYIHAEGETTNPRQVALSFGPEHAPLDKLHIEHSLNELQNLKQVYDILILAAFQFDPEAVRMIHSYNKQNSKATKIVQTQMNMDLQTEDLKKNPTTNESFWLIGEPDVKLHAIKPNTYKVEVCGYDYYNPATGTIESGGNNKIAMWLLDPDYDGRAVFARQVFFPMGGARDGWNKLAKSLKTEIDTELIESYRGTESLSFQAGQHKKVAVKIIDDRGIESLKVLDLKSQT